MRSDLPSGTVTFLFTDVEGSTRLLHELGAEAYAEALAEHRRVIREACARNGGIEVDTQGDAFFFAFPTAPGALAAAGEMTDALASGAIHVRIGLHTGTPLLTDEGYVGGDVHRAARIAASGHGGQALVSSSTATLVEIDLIDLGEHRLKDLSAPERIYQLGDDEFPALKSLYRTNLPVPATPFMGRHGELAEVLALLSSEDTRLLTLTGPGGTGKTRLALQAAAEASEAFPDGIWWVPLAPLRDPKLVLETAAQVIGSKNGLAEHIADKEMLCLFDNFEQVVEAGAELAELLAACPNLDVLVTSRERLRVRGEQTYPVPPLAESDGMALFVARARAIDPSFTHSEAVAELCLRLDELPLALELAAGRTALFSPKQLLGRLSQRLDLLKGERDADPRQQTLRATIEWSYDLLSEEEQELFARLSVFAGGCSYEAAEEIARADPDTLQSLLDKSLLRKRESELGPRYWMLETIREYAAERLDASSEAEELARRHAEHFLALAEEAHPHLPLHPREWVERLEQEHDNFRAALDWLEAAGEGERTQQLAGALWPFWYIRGHVPEGRRRLESAIRADERRTAARATALNGATAMALERGNTVTARPWAEEALALHRALGDAWGTANSILLLGNVHAEERESLHRAAAVRGGPPAVPRARRRALHAARDAPRRVDVLRPGQPRSRADVARGRRPPGTRVRKRAHASDVARGSCRVRHQRRQGDRGSSDAEREHPHLSRPRRAPRARRQPVPLRPCRCSGGKRGGGRPDPVRRGGPARGDRRQLELLGRGDERRDARRHRHAARRSCLCRGLGARPGADARRGGRARP